MVLRHRIAEFVRESTLLRRQNLGHVAAHTMKFDHQVRVAPGSAIEQLVRALNPGDSPEIAKALHLAAAAVLIASLFATLIGLITLVGPMQESLGF